MQLTIIVISFFVMNLCWASSAPLKKFKTDYCTGFTEGTREKPDLWKHCCLEHDLFFWAGGSLEARDKVDLALRTCIEKTGVPHIARLMYLGVRTGNYFPFKLPGMHWGNSLHEKVTYEDLTESEISLIEREIMSGYDFITEDLKSKLIQTLHTRLDTK